MIFHMKCEIVHFWGWERGCGVGVVRISGELNMDCLGMKEC